MMYNPPHPGELLKYDVIEALGLTITDAANHLKITRATLSRIINGHANITPNLALRLEKAGISTARCWLAMQSAYDLYNAEKNFQINISPFLKPEINFETKQ